ncbi:MAG: hypothetical protein ACKOSS_04130, partial [Planctomycetia bacterium]
MLAPGERATVRGWLAWRAGMEATGLPPSRLRTPAQLLVDDGAGQRGKATSAPRQAGRAGARHEVREGRLARAQRAHPRPRLRRHVTRAQAAGRQAGGLQRVAPGQPAAHLGALARRQHVLGRRRARVER